MQAGERGDGPAVNRWMQLLAGIVCMVMIANLQYGWTLFVHPMHERFHWHRAAIQVAFTLFVLAETWPVPFAGWIVVGIRLMALCEAQGLHPANAVLHGGPVFFLAGGGHPALPQIVETVENAAERVVDVGGIADQKAAAGAERLRHPLVHVVDRAVRDIVGHRPLHHPLQHALHVFVG